MHSSLGLCFRVQDLGKLSVGMHILQPTDAIDIKRPLISRQG